MAVFHDLDALMAESLAADIERHAGDRSAELAHFVIAAATRWADRAAVASLAIGEADTELAQATRHHARRRLRADVRGALGRQAPETVRDATYLRANLMFGARLATRLRAGEVAL